MTDAELQQQFEALSLPFECWTHRAHVRMAYLHLNQYSFDEALARIRKSIKTYNAYHKVVEGPTSGYNETTTVAFLHLVNATMQNYGSVFPTADSEAFCDTHPQLMNRSALRLFYSPARRIHPAAKSSFVGPDLTPFPKVLTQQKGGPMPSFSRVAPSVYVSDIDQALKFYRDALGFALDNVDDPPRRAVVTSGSAVLHIDLNPAKAGSSCVHMMTDDLDGVVEKLRAAGVKLSQEPTVQPWGLRDIAVSDPDGNVFELAEPVRK